MGKTTQRVGSAVFFVVVLVGAFWWQSGQEDKASNRARQNALGIISTAKSFDANRDYFTSLLDAAHERAFILSYTSGRRLRSGRLDMDMYLASLLKGMRERAKADSRIDVYEALIGLQEKLRTQ